MSEARIVKEIHTGEIQSSHEAPSIIHPKTHPGRRQDDIENIHIRHHQAVSGYLFFFIPMEPQTYELVVSDGTHRVLPSLDYTARYAAMRSIAYLLFQPPRLARRATSTRSNRIDRGQVGTIMLLEVSYGWSTELCGTAFTVAPWRVNSAPGANGTVAPGCHGAVRRRNKGTPP